MFWDPTADPDADEATRLPDEGSDCDDKFPDLTGLPGTEMIEEASLERLRKALAFSKDCSVPWKKSPKTKPDKTWYRPTCRQTDWMHQDVKIEVGQGIGYIKLNRPDQNNSLNDTIYHGLMDAVFAFLDPTIRILVIMSEGKFFSCGDDELVLKHMRDGTTPEEGDGSVGNRIPMVDQTPVMPALEKLGEDAKSVGAFGDGEIDYEQLRIALLWQTMARMQCVTIALVDGIVMGSGLGLCACVDMVVATKNSYFSIDDAKRGLIPALMLPYLIQKLNPSVSRQVLCTGRNLSAPEAKQLGLVQEVAETVDDGHNIIAETCKVTTLAGPRSVEHAKELVACVAGAPITEQIMFFTANKLAEVTVSEEARVGMICLQQKIPKPWEHKPITPLYGNFDAEVPGAM